MAAKSDYIKVTEILVQTMTWASRYNKIVAGLVVTEDNKLKNHIQNYLDAHKKADDAHAWTRHLWPSPDNLPYKEMVDQVTATKDCLQAYCQDAISSQKPQWQILAERHGWQPVDKK